MSKHEEKTYCITIDPTPQKTKPPKTLEAVGTIYNNLNLVTGMTINEVATFVDQPFSYTWSGGIFDGSPSNKNWRRQTVIGLDFDNKELKITPDAVFKRFEEYAIKPQLWYHSFSSTNNLIKFRVMLFLDSEIQDYQIQNTIFVGLKSMFPEADSQAFSLARFFYGGTSPEILTYQPVDTLKLLEHVSINKITKDKGRTRSISAPLKGCSFFIGEVEENGEKKTILYNSDRNTSFSPSTNKVVPDGEEGERIDWKVARSRVKILDEFMKGEWLYHDQLFGLATNLINVKGGRKMMKKTMLKFNEQGITNYTENNFNILRYLNIINYPPKPIHEFSPYTEDSALYDLITEVKDQRGKIEILEKVQKIHLEEAEAKLNEEFNRVLQSGDKGKIYLFKLPTAIGKTKLITSVNGCTIALPTHQLKNEVKERMAVTCRTSPDPVVFNDDRINRMIDYNYLIGLPKKAISIIHNMVSNNSCYQITDEDKALAQAYIYQVEFSKSSDDTVLTTHSKALHTQFKHDNLIFDEDPMGSLIKIEQINVKDLSSLGSTLQNDFKKLTDMLDFLQEANPSEIIPTPEMDFDWNEMIEKVSDKHQIDSNIFGFFVSSFFMKDHNDHEMIHYVVRRELPIDKNIIILSATVSPYIYKGLFGDRVEVIDVGEVEQKGKVIQFTKRSCSRESLKRYGAKIGEELGDKTVITFKKHTHHFQNAVKDIYFGNCSGYDTLAGKDIAVIGTPHRNNLEYLMIAKVLGIDFETTNVSLKKVDYNGFRFKFNCYDNEQLREIQFALIESDLIQAVGRARTLRTPATVELYSNFPLHISDRFIY